VPDGKGYSAIKKFHSEFRFGLHSYNVLQLPNLHPWNLLCRCSGLRHLRIESEALALLYQSSQGFASRQLKTSNTEGEALAQYDVVIPLKLPNLRTLELPFMNGDRFTKELGSTENLTFHQMAA
jgi:hypothetical protein